MNSSEIVIYKDNKPITISKEHKYYQQVFNAIKNNTQYMLETILNTIEEESLANTLTKHLTEDIIYYDGVISYRGNVLKNALVDKIIQMINDGYKNLTPMVNFLTNLMENPSKRAIDELYTFLEKARLPITEDGHFIAYKKVRGDFKDIYTGTIDNSVGQKPSMPRYMVDDDKDNTCSQGLHFCSKEYLPHFGVSPSNQVVLLKINPRDVVSIPSDYNHTKGRCSCYEVIDQYIDDTLLENISVYGCCDCDDEEYDDTEYCDWCGNEMDKCICDDEERCEHCTKLYSECICEYRCSECHQEKDSCKC